MTGGYDEWAAARTTPLLRFAYVLHGSDEVAETAVRAALGRVWSSWETIIRSSEPDLMARRFVVDASPSRRFFAAPARESVAVGTGPDDQAPSGSRAAAWLDAMPLRRRAALVLRCLEDRSDPEIAEVLRTSESTVRAQLQRCLTRPDGDAATMTDTPLAAARDLLTSRASSAPSQLQRPPGAEAPPPPRPPGGAWVAAAAVLALIATLAFVIHQTRTPAGVITYPSVKAPHSWRYESYGGVQVQVPDTWGWGGAPVRAGIFGDRLGACGANHAAVRSPSDRSQYLTSVTPFVGRPAVMSDLCVPWGSDGAMPTTDAVWLGSPLAVGVKPLDAVVAETRAVGTQHVTVFSADTKLRREILGTATEVGVDGNGCPTRAVQSPIAGPTGLDPASLSVCVYSQDTGVPVLEWSGRVGAHGARAYVDAVGRAASATRGCTTTPSGQWVALGVHDSRRRGARWDVVNLACGRIVGAAGTESPLVPATVRDWATTGVTAYVAAPSVAGHSLRGYFRQPAG